MVSHRPKPPDLTRIWGSFLGPIWGGIRGVPGGSEKGGIFDPGFGGPGTPNFGPRGGRGCTFWRVFNNSPSRDKMGHFHFRGFRMKPCYTENGKKHDFQEFAKFGIFSGPGPGAARRGATGGHPGTPQIDPPRTPKNGPKTPQI